MRVFASVLLSFLSLVIPTFGAHHEVHVEVVSTLSQNVRGVGVGSPAGGLLGSAVPCSQPYPTDTVAVTRGNPGSVDQCLIAVPSHESTGTVQNRRVEAILTTEDGQTYYVVLGCQKQFGWCAPLADGQRYAGKVSDDPKWLADYQHRPVYGFVRVSLRPEGKSKVSYTIEYAVRVEVLKR
jgi:hypothetical protein